MRAAALVLSAFSGCLMVYSIYCKSKEDMLGVQAAGNAFALAASLLSGCWVAVILSALAIVRNLWTVGKTRKYFVVAAWVAAAVVTVLWEKAGFLQCIVDCIQFPVRSVPFSCFRVCGGCGGTYRG